MSSQSDVTGVDVEEWFTLEKAAGHLGVSTRTVRRWIKSGKLQARLEPGPYGRQYLVPRTGMAGLQIVRDVERAERRDEREAVPRVLEAYLTERESAMAREVARLRTEMQEALRGLREQQDMLLSRLEQVQRSLEALTGQGEPPSARSRR